MKQVSIAIALTFLSSTLAANNSDYSLTLEAGASHQSQLVVEEIDQFSSNGDTARYLSFDVAGDWELGEKFKLNAGYHYSDTSFKDNSDFDLAIGRLYSDVSYDLSIVTLGYNANRVDAKLGGDSFMDLDRDSFYLARLINNSIYLRAESTSIDKTFDTLGERNATNDATSFDTYFFYNQGQSFFSLGYVTEEESANQPEYSYDGKVYRATFSNKFGADNQHKIKLRWRYTDRDYQAVFPGLDSARQDELNTLGLSWEYYFDPKFALVTELENTNSSSNFESADYNANQISLFLRADL